jgi:hypothetical protein
MGDSKGAMGDARSDNLRVKLLDFGMAGFIGDDGYVHQTSAVMLLYCCDSDGDDDDDEYTNLRLSSLLPAAFYSYTPHLSPSISFSFLHYNNIL